MADQDQSAHVLETAGRLRSGVHDKLADIWWFLKLRGVFAFALGLFAIFWPDKNLGMLALAASPSTMGTGCPSSTHRQVAHRNIH